MPVTSIRIQPETAQHLETIAAKMHRSKSSIINQAIQEFIDQQSIEEARWADTLDALQSVRSGQVVDGDSVHEWLNSWGTEEEKKAPKV